MPSNDVGPYPEELPVDLVGLQAFQPHTAPIPFSFANMDLEGDGDSPWGGVYMLQSTYLLRTANKSVQMSRRKHRQSQQKRKLRYLGRTQVNCRLSIAYMKLTPNCHIRSFH